MHPSQQQGSQSAGAWSPPLWMPLWVLLKQRQVAALRLQPQEQSPQLSSQLVLHSRGLQVQHQPSHQQQARFSVLPQRRQWRRRWRQPPCRAAPLTWRPLC